MLKQLLPVLLLIFGLQSCRQNPQERQASTETAGDSIARQAEHTAPFHWEAANVYFLLTDRFNNGDPENDVNFDRTEETGKLRGFMGGDLQGITQKIRDGYFNDLGINAIWFTPVVEQIHGSTDESTGNTYGYHGYWTKDWTALDPNFGTREDLAELVDTAHQHGIRILMDVVLNHTGPVTEQDPAWPEEWVRQDPSCSFDSYDNTTACTLVDNLPDIRTESLDPVVLPDGLLAKWKKEGRLSTELDELQRFFERTGYPRAPKYYIMKWLTDYVHELGIDGFRVDTVKHADEEAWKELFEQASFAFESWKKKNPEHVLDDTPFFMVGEVYGYGASGGREYDFGDKKVDYYDYGFNSLINFELKNDADKEYETIFKKYHKILHGSHSGIGVMNYLSSHDDGHPYDKSRERAFRAANVLLLTPGTSQVYYGDESSRSLDIPGTEGDATLRSFMNWKEIDSLPKTQSVLEHWQKLGQFRRDHPAVGAGRHKRLSTKPYVFSRTFTEGEYRDKVVIGLELPAGKKNLSVKGFFGDGTRLHDAYSGTEVLVKNGQVALDNPHSVALLELVQ